MKRQSSNRTGVLIVRLWIEANHERGLRARITQTLDTAATEQSVAVAASADDICVVVKRWVEDFAGTNSRDGHGQVPLEEQESALGEEGVPLVGDDV